MCIGKSYLVTILHVPLLNWRGDEGEKEEKYKLLAMQTYFNGIGIAIPMNIFVERKIGFLIFNTSVFYLLAFAR